MTRHTRRVRDDHRRYECQLCGRHMNELRDLQAMRRPAAGEQPACWLKICGLSPCREEAQHRGFV